MVKKFMMLLLHFLNLLSTWNVFSIIFVSNSYSLSKAQITMTSSLTIFLPPPPRQKSPLWHLSSYSTLFCEKCLFHSNNPELINCVCVVSINRLGVTWEPICYSPLWLHLEIFNYFKLSEFCISSRFPMCFK